MNDLDLRIGFDSSTPKIKIYNLIPDLGITRGFGVNKDDRSALSEVIYNYDYSERDCVYLLLSHMSVNYVGTTQDIVRRLGEHATRRNASKNWDRSLVFLYN
ncbi:MAG: GIY-YIG nuclease family protein [Chloroflexota bacterium]